METRSAPSLSTIAAALGVSKAAVSLVLGGKARAGGISRALEAKIRAHCRRVDYLPNIHARRLGSRLAGNVGFLLEETVNIGHVSPFDEHCMSLIVGGIGAAADQAGFRFSMQFFKPGMAEAKVFDWFRTREIDGLIYYGFAMPPRWLARFRREGRQVVGIGIDPALGLPTVNIDNFAAAQALTEQLVRRERRRFFYLGGRPESYPGAQRYLGFRAALAKHKVRFFQRDFAVGGFSEKTAHALIGERLAAGPFTNDAIVCANDEMAVGAILALRKAGIAVPGQVAVAGADNSRIGSYITPALTTFDNLPFEQGREAFNLLHGLIRGETVPAAVTLQSSLCMRESA